jgi:CRP/FNR family cyclic AMP-dependent transcriptional regulator
MVEAILEKRQTMIPTQIMKAVPLFATLPATQLATLLEFATVRQYPRNTFLLRAGAKAGGLYVILSGSAKVLMSGDTGREVTLARLGAQDFFGEMGLFDDQQCIASVETLEPSEVLHISKAEFMRCVSENPQLGMRITCAVIKRLRDADRQIESLALMDVYGRVARVLTEMAELVDGRHVILKAPTKQEIANMTGATREMVQRVMKGLQDRGHIQMDKRRIVLLDKLGTRRPAVVV